jgi:hypothetical protein
MNPDNETLQLALELGFIPVVPPNLTGSTLGEALR